MTRPLWFLASASIACSTSPKAPPAPQVYVAAAADLTHAFEELGQRYSARTGAELAFTFGSSGLLAKQIVQGAPFDLCAAANVAFVEQTVSRGACDGGTQAPYARGRIALWSREGSPLAPTDLSA